MPEREKLFLLRGVFMGLVYAGIGYWWKGWEVALTIFLAQLLFQVLMLYVFPQLQRENPLHWVIGGLLLISLLALVGLFYLSIRYNLSLWGIIYLPQ